MSQLNRGYLMRADKKAGDGKAPDHVGKLNVAGVDCELSAWVREKNGKKYFRVEIVPPASLQPREVIVVRDEPSPAETGDRAPTPEAREAIRTVERPVERELMHLCKELWGTDWLTRLVEFAAPFGVTDYIELTFGQQVQLVTDLRARVASKTTETVEVTPEARDPGQEG